MQPSPSDHTPSWQMKAPSAWWVSTSLQESGWRESSQNIDSPACACSKLIVNFSWSTEGVSLNNISALWFNPTHTTSFFFLHAWVNSYACQSACCSAGLCVAAAVVHKECANMCVCQPLTLCSFPSKLIWLLTRLDGKGPGARSAHSISRWESPLCCHHKAFLLTGHAQWATPHTAPPPPPPPFLPGPVWTSQSEVAVALSLVSHLTFKARHGDSRLTGEEGRRGVFFLKALWVAGLICHSLFPLCALALSQACNDPAPHTQGHRRLHNGFAIKRRFNTIFYSWLLHNELTADKISLKYVCALDAQIYKPIQKEELVQRTIRKWIIFVTESFNYVIHKLFGPIKTKIDMNLNYFKSQMFAGKEKKEVCNQRWNPVLWRCK